MTETAWRPLVCVGVVVGGLFAAGPAAGTATADPGRSDGGDKRHSRDAGKRDGDRRDDARRGPRGDDRSENRRPHRSGAERDRHQDDGDIHDRRQDDGDVRGHWRNDGDIEPRRDSGFWGGDPGRFDTSVPGFRHSLAIPVVRLPSGRAGAAKDPCGGAPCLTTLRIPVPTVSDAVSLLRAEPEPEPAPGPAFRGGEEPSVVDASGSVGGDSGRAGAPTVLEAPMIVAAPPGAATVVGVLPAAAAPAGVAGPGPATAPPSGGTATPPLFTGPAAPGPGWGGAGGPAVRFGVPPHVRPAGTAADLMGALPGLLGLFLVTICGGFIGYRQASAGRYVRSGGADRFLE